jgi:mannose-1-phosphate guanylyltransferase
MVTFTLVQTKLETHQRTEENYNLWQSHHDIVKSPNLSRTVNKATKILETGNITTFGVVAHGSKCCDQREITQQSYQY